jgi:alkanesulfonate monooxygenase SsuD/methylene tetrahydromethanopterin reductase-like flavin-dependent oxidoreductase (luciferase family)
LLLAGERVDFDGERLKLKRFKLGFKPLRPDIPIYIAALTPNSLRQISKLADGWLPTHWPYNRLADGIAEILHGVDTSSRNTKRIEIAPFVNVIVSDDLASARTQARLPLAYYVGGMGNYYHDSLARLGFAVEAARIRDLWQAGRPKDAIAAVTDEMVDSIAICGPIESCRVRLDEMYSMGATLTLVPIPADGSIADKCRAIESLVR